MRIFAVISKSHSPVQAKHALLCRNVERGKPEAEIGASRGNYRAEHFKPGISNGESISLFLPKRKSTCAQNNTFNIILAGNSFYHSIAQHVVLDEANRYGGTPKTNRTPLSSNAETEKALPGRRAF